MGDQVGLTIVVPTFNREKLLQKVIVSIEKVLPKNNSIPVEIFVINNSVEPLSLNFGRIQDITTVITEPHMGLHMGRNRGAQLARYSYVALLDDDVELAPGWFEGTLRNMSEDIGLFGGKNLPNWESAPPPWLLEQWNRDLRIPELSIIDLGDTRHETSPSNIWGCNYVIKKSIITESNGFHPDGFPNHLIKYRGDGESQMSRRVKGLGYKIMYDPEVSIGHFVSKERMSLDYFGERKFRQGISDSFTFLKNRPTTLEMVKRYMKLYYNKFKKNRYSRHDQGVIYHMNHYILDRSIRKWVHNSNYLNEKGKIENYG